MTDIAQTVTLAGVADILGMSRQAAHWHTNSDGFPAPVEVSPQGRRWSRAEVEAWAERRRAAAS